MSDSRHKNSVSPLLSGSPKGELINLFSKVEIGESCWLWTGPLNHDGYGLALHPLLRKKRGAHRVVYELLRGSIPAGLEIDHLCRVRACVNPDHMEVVTHRENTLRGKTLVAAFAARTHCNRGHALSGSNLCNSSEPRRRCLECARENNRAAYLKKVKA